MSRFVEINNKYVNMDTISQVHSAGRHGVRVTYKDGTGEFTPYYTLKSISGENHIVQVLPVGKKTVAIYKDEDSESGFSQQDIFYLGLTAEGIIRPLEVRGCGCFTFADDADNFVRLEQKGERWQPYEDSDESIRSDPVAE